MTHDDAAASLLEAYDAQLRAHVHDRLPESVQVERDGPLVRTTGFGNRGFVEYRDLAGIDGDELDALIARQIQVFAERARAVRVEAARARSSDRSPRPPARRRPRSRRDGDRRDRPRRRGDRRADLAGRSGDPRGARARRLRRDRAARRVGLERGAQLGRQPRRRACRRPARACASSSPRPATSR